MTLDFPLRTCIFLTRKCYMHCDYCRIRESPLESAELSSEEWVEAFKRLEDLGCDFNLILGNETLVLGQGLVDIIKNMMTPYALYTSAPPGLWHRWRQPLVDAGLRSLACGMDYPVPWNDVDSDMYRKSEYAWEALTWAKGQGIGDLQGTVTITSRNVDLLWRIIEQLDAVGIWTGFNFVHYAKDGGYDFFPSWSEIEGMLQWGNLEVTFERVASLIEGGVKCQFPVEYLWDFFKYGRDLSWHCSVPILAVDPNGCLRCCGYRRGREIRKFSIFDLPDKWDDFFKVWRQEVAECPGCYWSYPWLNEYWLDRDSEFGRVVLQEHASQYEALLCWDGD